MDILSSFAPGEVAENPEIHEVLSEGTDPAFHSVYQWCGVEIAVRRLPDGWGVFAYNHEEEPRIIYIDFAACSIPGVYRVRNVRLREDQGFAEKEIPVIVGPKDFAFFRLIALK